MWQVNLKKTYFQSKFLICGFEGIIKSSTTLRMRRCFVLLLVLLFAQLALSQERKPPVVINKQVEVVDYDYEYVYVELISSVNISSYYPLLTVSNPSVRQQFFEQGRNIRPCIEVGFQQSIKAGSWALSAGIGYQMYNEFFSYNEYETKEVTVQGDDNLLRTLLVAVGGPVPYSRDNQLGYLTIPIGLSYFPKRLNDKMGITLQGNFNYLLNADYMAKFSITDQATKIGYEHFTPSFFSLTGKLSFHQKLVKNRSLTAEPYVTIGFRKLIEMDDLRFGMNSAGLQLSFSIGY
jgi:hypothetical protein